MAFGGNVHIYSSEPERSVTDNLFQHPENPIPRVPNLKSQSRCQSWKTLAPPSGIHDPHRGSFSDRRSQLGSERHTKPSGPHPWSLTAAQELAASNGCPGDTDACAGSPRIPLQETLIWSPSPTCQLVTQRPQACQDWAKGSAGFRTLPRPRVLQFLQHLSPPTEPGRT